MMILLYTYIYIYIHIYIHMYTVHYVVRASIFPPLSLWSFKSEGHRRFSLLLTFSGLLNSVT
jgi:hypothetical protein